MSEWTFILEDDRERAFLSIPAAMPVYIACRRENPYVVAGYRGHHAPLSWFGLEYPKGRPGKELGAYAYMPQPAIPSPPE